MTAAQSAIVRSIDSGDLDRVVSAHLAAFPGFLMSLLGPSFLRSYYKTVLDYEKRIFIGAFDSEGSLVGFVAGFADPAEFYRLFGMRKRKLMAAALLHVAVRPWIWGRVLGNMREVRHRSEGVQGGSVSAELASLAVDPRFGRQGYGKMLVTAFVSYAWEQLSIRRVNLTTDAADNDAVNSLYANLGFVRSGIIQRAGGRVMNSYTHEIGSSS